MKMKTLGSLLLKKKKYKAILKLYIYVDQTGGIWDYMVSSWPWLELFEHSLAKVIRSTSTDFCLLH